MKIKKNKQSVAHRLVPGKLNKWKLKIRKTMKTIKNKIKKSQWILKNNKMIEERFLGNILQNLFRIQNWKRAVLSHCIPSILLFSKGTKISGNFFNFCMCSPITHLKCLQQASIEFMKKSFWSKEPFLKKSLVWWTQTHSLKVKIL